MHKATGSRYTYTEGHRNHIRIQIPRGNLYLTVAIDVYMSFFRVLFRTPALKQPGVPVKMQAPGLHPTCSDLEGLRNMHAKLGPHNILLLTYV